MGTINRRDTTDIIEELNRHGPSFHVWQAVWIGENISKTLVPQRKDYLLDQTGLRFQPSERYEFPPRDIKEISFNNNEINYTLTFMGLYGINSPLPRCYHEQVPIQQRTLGANEVPLQNFFDIFNNRFYWLYYQAWKKYRYYLYFNSGSENKITERIKSFVGVGFSNKKKSLISDYTLLKFSSLFSQRARSKNGLEILLKYIFKDYKINVKEFTPQWIELHDIPGLGSQNYVLGQNSFIGKSIMDCMSRITLEIGPINFEDYLNFLPGTKLSNRLVELLKLYVNDGLEFDFMFKIKSDTIISISWDDVRLKLGSTLWLGIPKDEIVKVYLKYEELGIMEN